MKKEIAEAIRQARLRRGETQAELAERLGVSQQLVSRIERGQGSLEALRDLCRGLGILLQLRVGEQSFTLVHPIDPEERKEIEANIDWFSRLKPAERLRTAARNLRALERLRRAARRGKVKFR